MSLRRSLPRPNSWSLAGQIPLQGVQKKFAGYFARTRTSSISGVRLRPRSRWKALDEIYRSTFRFFRFSRLGSLCSRKSSSVAKIGFTRNEWEKSKINEKTPWFYYKLLSFCVPLLRTCVYAEQTQVFRPLFLLSCLDLEGLAHVSQLVSSWALQWCMGLWG